MTILVYDWHALKRHSVRDIKLYLYNQATRGFLYKRARIPQINTKVTDSFLVNVEGICKDRKSKQAYLYLYLASLRNYTDYLVKGDTRLPLRVALSELAPVLTTLKQIENNELITIRNDNIYFKYEENR